MTPKIVISSVLALCLTAGCTTRFSADFEADTAGGAPDLMPAGMPNDRIFANDNTGLVVVRATGALTDSQSLRLRGPAPQGGGGPEAVMLSEPINDTNQRVYGNWTGQLSNNAGVRVVFQAGQTRRLVDIRLSGGNVNVNGDTVGTYTPGTQHFMFVNANPADDTYNFTFSEPGNTFSDTGTVFNAGSFPQSRVSLRVQLRDASETGSYLIDSVRMSERNPTDDAPSG